MIFSFVSESGVVLLQHFTRLDFLILTKFKQNWRSVLKGSDDGVLHLKNHVFGLCPLSNVSIKHIVSEAGSVSIHR